MLGGTELIRRKLGKDASAMTITLLLNSEGKKMGKTVSGAVWLDPEKTSPYEFFQYWRNVDDADVIKCLKMLTFLPLEEIEEMGKWQGAELNKAKEILGYELTKLVHGEEEAKKALDAAKNIFAKGGISGDIPTTTYAKAELEQGIDILTILVDTKLAKSRSEARTLVNQNSVSVNGEKVNAIDKTLTTADFNDEGVILIKKGKKAFHQIKAD